MVTHVGTRRARETERRERITSHRHMPLVCFCATPDVDSTARLGAARLPRGREKSARAARRASDREFCYSYVGCYELVYGEHGTLPGITERTDIELTECQRSARSRPQPAVVRRSLGPHRVCEPHRPANRALHDKARHCADADRSVPDGPRTHECFASFAPTLLSRVATTMSPRCRICSTGRATPWRLISSPS